MKNTIDRYFNGDTGRGHSFVLSFLNRLEWKWNKKLISSPFRQEIKSIVKNSGIRMIRTYDLIKY